MDPVVKQEIIESGETPINESLPLETAKPISVIDLSSSGSDSDESTDSEKKLIFDASGKKNMDSNCIRSDSSKKRKFDNLGVVLPHGFLDPLFPEEAIPLPQQIPKSQSSLALRSCKQFWKAGDYEGGLDDSSSSSFGGMDHVRVHPKFLHSNATSHKWALGAFAELLDNSLDEICHGVTFANIDMLKNKKDGSKMLLVEDNGGGMDPDRMRHCMSLGYSMKSKSANTIGQYGNGFKTSTMRLGADVIVFSRCNGQYGKSPTQSIGMLSYTFLRDTGKEDIVVPMLDYQKVGQDWNKMMRPSPSVWDRNVNTIVQWSPYTSEADLLDEFNLIEDQGTRVIIYNLWEDDQGELELDFDTDQHDIQIRGVNRDEKKIEMAEKFPNSKHFLTYRHSLRSYASILYLRIPPGFRIGLRGKDIEHHDIMNDMMLIQEVTYRPQPGPDGIPKDSNIFAVVNIGFVKDAKEHIDVQGFNVYHKNRLIKPFWRVWNAAGSDGRGVIGVLEANFVEPAHDKQGFERTIVLSRLEARLVQMQKTYWSSNCHKIGYAPRHKKKFSNGSPSRESSPNYPPNPSSRQVKKATPSKDTNPLKNGSKKPSSTTSPFAEDDRDSEMQAVPPRSLNFNMDNNDIEPDQNHALNGRFNRVSTRSQSVTADDARNGHKSDHDLKDRLKKMEESYLLDLEFERERCRLLEDQINKHSPSNSDALSQYHLLMENHELKEKLRKTEESLANDLQFERERCKSLEAQIMESERKLEDMDKEQEAIIEIFSEERSRRDEGEENLRKKVKDTSATIQELQAKVAELEAKVAELEKMRVPVCKQERET